LAAALSTVAHLHESPLHGQPVVDTLNWNVKAVSETHMERGTELKHQRDGHNRKTGLPQG